MQAHHQARDVERIGSISRSTFEQAYLAPQRPVILTEPATQWQAVQKWNLTYLQSVLGDHRVAVEYYPSGRRSDASALEDMSLGDYIQRVRDDQQARRQYYLAEQPIEAVLPGLLDDIQAPAIMGPRERRQSFNTVVFIGYDTFTTAHYHSLNSQALLTQIVGEKQVTLYPASDLACLYPYSWHTIRPNFSRIPFEFEHEGDLLEQFPKLTNAHPWQCTIQTGEMLFIPDHWMHTVSGYGENMSVTFFWKESWRYAYLPGVGRDVMAVATRKVLSSLARMCTRLGVHRHLITAGVALGIVPPADKETIIRNLSEKGQK